MSKQKAQDTLKWLFIMIVFAFIAVFYYEIAIETSVFQTFSQSIIKLEIPYIHHVVAVFISLIILLLAYIFGSIVASAVVEVLEEADNLRLVFFKPNEEKFEIIAKDLGIE